MNMRSALHGAALVAALTIGAYLGASWTESAGQPWMALGGATGVAAVYGLIRWGKAQ